MADDEFYSRTCSEGQCPRANIHEKVEQIHASGGECKATTEQVNVFAARRMAPGLQPMEEPFERTTDAIVTSKGCVFGKQCEEGFNRIMRGLSPHPPPPVQQKYAPDYRDRTGQPDEVYREAWRNNPGLPR